MFRNRKPLLGLLMPLVLAGCASAPNLTARITGRSEDAYQETFLSARMTEQKGELLKASQQYEELLKKYPRKAELHHRLGILSQKSGRPEQAVNYLNQAHQISPMDVDILCDLGYSHYLQGNAEEALKIFQQAQQIKPGHTRTQSNLAIALIELDQVPAAMSLLRQSMGEAAAATTVGFALAQKGELTQAQHYFSQALDTDASNQQAAEALVQIKSMLANQNSPGTTESLAGAASQLPAFPREALLAKDVEKDDENGTVITETDSIDTIGLTALAAGSPTVETSDQSASSVAEKEPASTTILASDLRLIGTDHALQLTESGGGIDKGRVGSDKLPVSEKSGSSPIVSVSDPQEHTKSGIVEISSSVLKHPVSRRESSDSRGVWRSAQHGSQQSTQSRQIVAVDTLEKDSDRDLADFVQGSPIESIHDAGRSSRKATIVEPQWGSRHDQQYADDAFTRGAEDYKAGQEYAAAAEDRRYRSQSRWSRDYESRESIPAPEATPAPSIVISGQTFDYQRLAQMAASGQLQLNQYPGTPGLPQQPMAFSSANPIPIQGPALTQVAYMQPQPSTAVPQAYVGTPGQIPAGLMAVPQVAGTPNPGYVQASAAFPPAGAHVPGAVQQNAGIPVPAFAAGYNPNQQPVVQAATIPQYLPGQQPGVAVTAASMPSVVTPLPAATPLPIVYALGQQVSVEQNATVPSAQAHAAVSSATSALPQMLTPVVSTVTPAAPAFPITRGTESTERVSEAKTAPPVAASATGTVGGLPLAFLRSFYSQMPQDQKTTFWRDLRQLPGTVSPAELAAYRELALSATDLARVEAAITMLAVYNQKDLAEELLKGMHNHPDPIVQQSAQTALSMLRISGAPAK